MRPLSEVVIGATDVEEMVAFFARFGFEPIGQREIAREESRAVFGLDAARTATSVAASGAPSPSLLIVPTPHDGAAVTGWSVGPRALDIYTADLDRTLEIARTSGCPVSPVGQMSAGPMTMRQAMVTGPGGAQVVFVESTHRRSSILDGDESRLHSEPHSVVWAVGDHAAEVTWWTTGGWTSSGEWAAGFQAGNTIAFSEPTICDELGLPERPTPIRMTMLSDEAVAPLRLELMTFDDHLPDEPAEVVPQLQSGLFAVSLDGCGGERQRLVLSPGGVRLVVRP
jgi:catechol 2,3-dioxygenase-like lactoylglutathione lyase family enzyme